MKIETGYLALAASVLCLTSGQTALPGQSPADTLKQIDDQYQLEDKMYSARLKCGRISKKVWLADPIRKAVPKVLRVLKDYPNDPAAYEAAVWIINNGRGRRDLEKQGLAAMNFVRSRYVNKYRYQADIFGLNAWRSTEKTKEASEDLLPKLVEENP